MAKKYSVAVFYTSGQRTILSHKDKTEWSLPAAQKHADEFAAKFGERVIVFDTDTPIPAAPAGSRKDNPLRKGTSRPRRVSQITHEAPTKRLIKRRKANTDEGYFPNPAPANKLKYEVLVSEGFEAWYTVAVFHSPKEAIHYSKNLAARNPRFTVKVESQ